MIARDIGAVAGGILVLSVAMSVTGTVVVPRPVRNWLTRSVDWAVDRGYRMVTRVIRDDRRRDALLATRAATLLLAQLGAWLLAFFVGFGLLLLPFTPHGFGADLAEAGSDMTTIGFTVAHGAASEAIAILAAFASLATIALQIGYLPALYGAYNRRENSVALLAARAGVPTWGPELLARTHYGLGTGSTLETLPDLYAEWERWAADIAESHRTYLPLVYFRSPRPLSSWVTALLGVLDSAALYLALCPSSAPTIPARLCLRSGFVCFNLVAQAMGYDIPDEADPAMGIALTYEDFLFAVERLRSVHFAIERDPQDAWPDFVGWRVNYEKAAYDLASAVSAPPALWSGPRRIPTKLIPPLRPPDLRAPA